MKCTGKEWDTCRVEKMGCTGCYYDEIEVDEYIRTEKGYILKVDNEKKVLKGLKFLDVQYGKVTNHSKDILDLIKAGDILKIKEDDEVCYIGLEKDTITVNYSDIKESIKNGECELLAILTKEQFNSNCFKVVQ